MAGNLKIDQESPGVQKHLEIMQGVITRMAENSRYCKVWCVTLVAATLVLVARTGEPRHVLIALIPTLLFLFLDSYYLALERAFIKSQNNFVDKLHEGRLEHTDLYKVMPVGMGVPLIGRCLTGSISIWPFYVLVASTVFVSWGWVL